MKFGGLSEQEAADISKILESEGIAYTVGTDDHIKEFNEASLKNNLRHYSPPHLSTHILAVTLTDEDFHKLSDESKNRLAHYGITDTPPVQEDFVPASDHSLHKELAEGPKRLVAFTFKHLLILTAVFMAAMWILQYMLNIVWKSLE